MWQKRRRQQRMISTEYPRSCECCRAPTLPTTGSSMVPTGSFQRPYPCNHDPHCPSHVFDHFDNPDRTNTCFLRVNLQFSIPSLSVVLPSLVQSGKKRERAPKTGICSTLSGVEQPASPEKMSQSDAVKVHAAQALLAFHSRPGSDLAVVHISQQARLRPPCGSHFTAGQA